MGTYLDSKLHDTTKLGAKIKHHYDKCLSMISPMFWTFDKIGFNKIWKDFIKILHRF